MGLPEITQVCPTPRVVGLNARLLSELTSTSQMEAYGRTDEPRNPEEGARLVERVQHYNAQMGLWAYRPHDKQWWLHQSNSKHRVFVGSNQSGKTTWLIEEILSTMLGYRPWLGEDFHPRGMTPMRCMIACDDFTNKVNEVIEPKIRELIPWDLVIDRKQTSRGPMRALSKLVTANGSSCKFLSYEMDPKKWEGYTWRGKVGFDEPPPRHAMVGTKRGCMKYSVPLLFAFTPLSEPYIYDELYNHPDAVHLNTPEDVERSKGARITCVTIALRENPFISEAEKKEFEESLDEEERAARIEGKFTHLMGRVYKTFSEKDHVLPEDFLDKRYPPDADGCGGWTSWPAGVAVDPHDRRPFAISFFVVSPHDEIFWIDEWPTFDFFSVRSCDWEPSQYATFLTEWVKSSGLTMQWWLMDGRFAATPKATSNTTLQEEFENLGIYFEMVSSESVEAGHLKVRKRINTQKMFWLETCQNGKRAMLNYTWDDWGRNEQSRGPKEKPKEKYKDFPDTYRIAVEAGVSWLETQAKVFNPYEGVQNLGIAGGGAVHGHV